jgi:plastocyanin
MSRVLRALAGLLAIGWAALACLFAFAPAAQATSHAVDMSNYAFAPATITVHVGDSITWTNHDQAPHNVVTTKAPASIDSPMLSNGKSWSYTFTTPGTYSYICGVHPDMHATVIVLAAPIQTTTAPAATQTPTPAPSSAMSMPMPAASTHAHTSAHAVAAASTAKPAPIATVTQTTVVTQSGGVTTARLKPLLLVAGVIAAVTVFCLLALASRPEPPAE